VPTVRHRRLARELRIARERAGLSREQAARSLGCDPSKLSRVEGAKVRPKLGDVENMLDLYGVPSPDRDALLQLARDARKRGWWTTFGGVLDGAYVGLEDEATSIFSWQPQRIPGLLQTEDYARAVLTASPRIPTSPTDPNERWWRVEEHVRARMARQLLLTRPTPPTFHAVLGEGALRLQVGGPAAHRRQLERLLEATELPNVTLQVLPFTVGAHAGMDGSFVLLRFADPDDPDVVYIEGQEGDVYPESAEQLARIRLAEERLVEAALSPEESIGFLHRLVKE